MFNVRWATEDPNPKARAEFLDDAKDRMFEAIKSKATPEMMDQYVMMAQSEMASEDQQVTVGKNVRVTDFYPSTDSQYGSTPQDVESMKYGYTQNSYAAAESNAYANYYAAQGQGGQTSTDPNYQYQGYYQGYGQDASAYQQAYYQSYGGYDYSGYQQQQASGETSTAPAEPANAAAEEGTASGKRKRGEGDEGEQQKKSGAVSLVSYASDEE